MSESEKNKEIEESPVSKDLSVKFQDFMKSFWAFFSDTIDLRQGLDRKGTIESIVNNKRMRGANVWLLMCAIMVASIGLNMNSPAVIIGAMLISPLMSPILGVGLAIGINDRKMLYGGLQHLGIAIAISLIVSVLYFWITPFSNITPEMRARTSPTILDVMVAFFGGVAGIVSGSRLDKSNAIPGVAIATALLPPLCVSGYGLASGEWQVFLNSFYLFFINCVFVALSTFVVVRFLNFPFKAHVNDYERRRANWIIGIFIVLVMVPSFFIFRQVLNKYRIEQHAMDVERFVEANFSVMGCKAELWEEVVDTTTNKTELNVYVISKAMNFDSLAREKEPALIEAGLENTVLKIKPMNINDNDILRILNSKQNSDEQLSASLETKLKGKEQEITLKNLEISRLNSKVDSLSDIALHISEKLQKSLIINYPDLKYIELMRGEGTSFDSTRTHLPKVLVKWNKRLSKSRIRNEEKKLIPFLELETGLDTLIVIRF